MAEPFVSPSGRELDFGLNNRDFDLFSLAESEQSLISQLIKNRKGCLRVFIHPFCKIEDKENENLCRYAKALSTILASYKGLLFLGEEVDRVAETIKKIRLLGFSDPILWYATNPGNSYPAGDRKNKRTLSLIADKLKDLKVVELLVGGQYVDWDGYPPGSYKGVNDKSSRPYITYYGEGVSHSVKPRDLCASGFVNVMSQNRIRCTISEASYPHPRPPLWSEK